MWSIDNNDFVVVFVLPCVDYSMTLAAVNCGNYLQFWNFKYQVSIKIGNRSGLKVSGREAFGREVPRTSEFNQGCLSALG